MKVRPRRNWPKLRLICSARRMRLRADARCFARRSSTSRTRARGRRRRWRSTMSTSCARPTPPLRRCAPTLCLPAPVWRAREPAARRGCRRHAPRVTRGAAAARRRVALAPGAPGSGGLRRPACAANPRPSGHAADAPPARSRPFFDKRMAQEVEGDSLGEVRPEPWPAAPSATAALSSPRPAALAPALLASRPARRPDPPAASHTAVPRAGPRINA
jgi:hypothetical protein